MEGEMVFYVAFQLLLGSPVEYRIENRYPLSDGYRPCMPLLCKSRITTIIAHHIGQQRILNFLGPKYSRQQRAPTDTNNPLREFGRASANLHLLMGTDGKCTT